MGRIDFVRATPRLIAAAVLAAMGLLSAGDVWAQGGAALKAYSPQPTPDALKPGLTVRYYTVKIRYMDELVRFVKSRPGTPGPVIAALDFADKGPGANVMGTKQPELVGAVIDGLIRFDQPGRYELAMVVNDGVHLHIGDRLVIEKDWDGMPSLMGDSVWVAIEQPGWYQLHVKYFQRKGTAALELYWKKPGQAGEVELVPAEAFAHIPE